MFSSVMIFLARLKTALRSVQGAFDLPSIMVGVATVAILTVGVFAAVFGVIPAAQDHTARQDLSAVRTAEGVTKAQEGVYQDGTGLETDGYLASHPNTSVGADAAGACWIGFVKSQSGAVFFLTDSMADPQIYASGTDAGCLSVAEQEALAVSAGATPTFVAVGYGSSWGNNSSGMLGDGTTTTSSVPVAVMTSGVLAGKSVTSVSTGIQHTCAVADGAAYCWGPNGFGQLGDGTVTTSADPVAVDVTGALAGKTVTYVSAGANHSCAIADGALYCWGSNTYGQLGNGTTTRSSLPVVVDMAGVLAGKTVTDVAAGGFQSCAIADGASYCWGYNGFGQLGTGTTTQSNVPDAVDTTGVLAGKTITAVTAGDYHTCAVGDGAAYCWGYNNSGRLGNGTTTQSNLPVAVAITGVLAGKTVTDIEAGTHTCAVASGAAYCWGGIANGQLGNGSTTQSLVPVTVTATGILAGKTVTSATAGESHSCAIASGAAYCWGGNANGRLGDGSTTQSLVPVTVTAAGILAGKTITALEAGAGHTVAIYK